MEEGGGGVRAIGITNLVSKTLRTGGAGVETFPGRGRWDIWEKMAREERERGRDWT